MEALKEQKTLQEIANEFEIHTNQIATWKRDFLSKADQIFYKPSDGKTEDEKEKEHLYRAIGEQKVEIDFLKQVLGKYQPATITFLPFKFFV